VFNTVSDFKNKIKSYGKPMFIESVTYRYRGHSKSDRNLYRTSDEIEFWKEEKDPLKRFIGKLTEENIEVEKLKEIETEVREIIRDSVKKALQSPESPKTNLEEDSYA
jgi:pyruvate dehydrogenase E1 component alpha subunit